MAGVAFDIAPELWKPIRLVRFREPRVEAVLLRMQMPETAMHEDHLAARPENKIGFSRQIFGVEAVAIAEGMDDDYGSALSGVAK